MHLIIKSDLGSIYYFILSKKWEIIHHILSYIFLFCIVCYDVY